MSTTRGSGISGHSRSAGTGQCINRSEPQFWYMIGKPDGRVLTERRSTPSIGSRLTLSDSALAGGRASRGKSGPQSRREETTEIRDKGLEVRPAGIISSDGVGNASTEKSAEEGGLL